MILAHVGYVFRAVVRIGVHLLGDENTKGSTEGVIAPHPLIFESQKVVVIEILQKKCCFIPFWAPVVISLTLSPESNVVLLCYMHIIWCKAIL